MAIKAVGILSPGDMGHSVGKVLVDHRMKVLTCLKGRSERTINLAREAGITDTPSYEQFVNDVDVILSILVPAEAVNAAAKVSTALKSTRRTLTYVDCNAVSPETKKKIGQIITGTGSRFIDVGIIGPPPSPKGKTRFYASGPNLDELKTLGGYGLDIRVLGSEIGQASGLKMTFAAMTKGFTAICTELLVAAHQMGLYDALVAELKENEKERYAMMERGIPSMVYRARRWIGEMEEIARTFEDLGLTPEIYHGVADIYRLVGSTPLADETAETYDKNRTLAQAVTTIAESVGRKQDEKI